MKIPQVFTLIRFSPNRIEIDSYLFSLKEQAGIRIV